jgi:hypothetical protein
MVSNVCADCGGAVRTKHSVRCRACWMKRHMAKTSRPTCQVCGKQISWVAGRRTERHIPKRCRDCYIKELKANPPRLRTVGCSVEGCPNKHKAHGLCRTHYNLAQFRGRRPWTGVKRYVATLPCCICGYAKMRSHVHRLGHVGGYDWGRVIPVCQRCHDEIISKITPEPPAGIPKPAEWTEPKRRPARTATNAARLPLPTITA